MDKNKIKKFAVEARKKLLNSVELKLADYGITKGEIKNSLDISTSEVQYFIDETKPLTGKQIKWRQDIVEELNSRDYQEDKEEAFNTLVEEVAYTWFNRIIAIRFMEVNNYLPTRVRVLSNSEKKAEPEIIDEALGLESDLGGYSIGEKQLITDALTERTPELLDKLYALLFIKQNDALADILPGLFEKTQDYLKLLFVPNYNRGIIKSLIDDIPESYFDISQEGQVQIIGWLYQYYNSAPHDKVVNMNGKAIKKGDIPAATQLFTPDWIVKYMVDNSLGKYYLERHTDSSLTEDLKYLLPDELKNVDDNTNITEYSFLDNAMGSGHILVYAFDLLMKMYIESGYSKRDAAVKIIENNLYGLELDKRAYQLAYFAIMMKGREYNRRIFRRNINNNLYYFEDLHVPDNFYDEIDNAADREELKKLLAPFEDAQELGSIIKLDGTSNLEHLIDVVENLQIDDALDVFGNKRIQRKVLKTLNIIKVMSKKYTAVVTNPPYMNKFDKTLKKYLKDNYKDYSKDLFSVFIYHNLQMLIENGYAGYMAPLVWMFIKTYEPLRHIVINNSKIDSLIQLEYSAFEEATVPIDTFVLKKSDAKIGTYLRLSDFKGGMQVQEEKTLEAINDSDVKYLYHTDQTNFDKIPGSPIAYWVSENLIHDFEEGTPLGELVDAKQGLATADNKRFLRQWFEVGINNIKFDAHNLEEAQGSHKKWFPLNKGGSYRKWYGNYDYVVNWENDGYEIKHFTDSKGKVRSRPQNTEYYFKEALTWPKITSGKLSARFRESGSIHETAGNEAFSNNKNTILQIIGFVNSKVANYVSNILNPTLNSQIGDFISLPILKSNSFELKYINQNISLSKQDWDAFETSWDFQKSPLLTSSNKAASLEESYNNWAKEAEDRFNQLKSNEEELNKIFIDLYGLQDELSSEEEDKDVSVRKADQVRDIKTFLSYFIGCVFGRYSLDEDGLAYAGGEWNPNKYKTFKPNKDNIILLTDHKYFDDERDIIVRLQEFLAKTFDPDKVLENMDFIARTLDLKKFEKGTSSEEIIRTYFIKDFYKDHARIYQKRPIYWEFNSGRSNGFKALMYLHRYSLDELAMARNYLHQLEPEMASLVEADKKLLENETMAGAKSAYRKTIKNINKQLAEMTKYDQILEHLSQSQIKLDLDDGVLENHKKLQQGENILSKL